MNECAYCGADVAEGWAWVNDLRFCHSDTLIATCYMQYLWAVEAEEVESWLEWTEEEDV